MPRNIATMLSSKGFSRPLARYTDVNGRPWLTLTNRAMSGGLLPPILGTSGNLGETEGSHSSLTLTPIETRLWSCIFVPPSASPLLPTCHPGRT